MEPAADIEVILTQLRTTASDVFAVHDITVGYEKSGVIRLRGQLLVESSEAYTYLARGFREVGYTPLLRREKGVDAILAVPGLLAGPGSASRPWLAGALFLATLVSVLFAGALLGRVRPERLFTLDGLLQGWPFAVSLLSILAAHELGHYFVARHFGTPVSLPYFIPMPLNSLGTMGAVIRMQGPPRNRPQLLAIGAAGPLAGLVLAVPVLLLGLSLSEISRIPPGPVLAEGNSLLYVLLKWLVFGRYLPSGGMDVFLHPVAFAGWAGLMVTGVNLIPVGQLDGGHVFYVLAGRHARWLKWVVIGTLAGLGLLWQGWFLWAGLLLILGQHHPVILDEITHLKWSQQLLAVLMLVLFILTFVPIPMRIA